MKKSILYILAASALMLTACDDLLDKTPRDTFSNTQAFWNNSDQVKSYSNGFYEYYVGYGTEAGWFYFKTLNDDQANPSFTNWTYLNVPNKASDWSGKFTNIRRVNYMLDGLKRSSLPAADKAKYIGIGRLNRAWEYYQLVREYGDVQWESSVITTPDDPATYGERTNEDAVMDSVLADLDYAIANIPEGSSKFLFSKQMALAMKSDICLYYGTYAKYRTAADNGHAADNAVAQKFLQESVKASEALMGAGYKLTTNYGEIYNALDLSKSSEVIFARHYEQDVVGHGLADYTCGSTTQSGITKDAIDAFLFLDGKPKASTTYDTDDRVVANKDGDGSIAHLLAKKDKRLSVLVDSIVSYKGHGWTRVDPNGAVTLPAQMTSSTGYTILKYDNASMPTVYRTSTVGNYTDAPLYWYAVVLLNEAEAKAELGTITQTDLDKTVNLLQARAGLPAMTVNPEADPANNHGVSNLLWEIRRCRRCELMTDNWYRYWDLVRWHQLDKLDSQKYPDINHGANLSAVDHTGSTVDANGYRLATEATRTFAAKYYHYPVPTNEITLNPSIKQNPGW